MKTNLKVSFNTKELLALLNAALDCANDKELQFYDDNGYVKHLREVLRDIIGTREDLEQ